MQRFLLMGVVGLTAVAMATPLGAADHCNGVIIDIGGTAYVEVRGGQPYVYLESNQIPGLQSGGAGSIPLVGPDACTHVNPDTLVF